MDTELPKATRFIEFDYAIIDGAMLIDAVREVAGTLCVEEPFFVNNEVAYMVGQNENVGAGNIVVSLMADDMSALFDPSEAVMHIIPPAQTGKGVIVRHGYVGAKRHTPQNPPNPAECYMAVRIFARKLEAALRARIMDPGIMNKRPPVIVDAEKYPGVTP